MSYGFYKMKPGSTHEEYLTKVAGNTIIAISVGSVVELNSTEVVATALVEPAPKQSIKLGKKEARAQGYSGDVCTHCQGTRLKWAGHCQVCDDCGSTTGCS